MRSWIRLIPLVTITVIFLGAIAFNISPFLLGPGPYYPDWRWAYVPSNTLSRLYAPLLCIFGIVYITYLIEKKNIKKNYFIFIVLLILLGFILQITLLFYSRTGILVLVNRIIDPLRSGYFTTALSVYSIPLFLHNFINNLGGYPMYAKFHPPASELLFVFILNVSHLFASHSVFLNKVQPTHSDVAKIWNGLLDYQKAAAIFSGFFIAFIANLALIPLFYSAKLLYGVKVAFRSVLLFLFIPSIYLFTPLNDAFLPLLTCSCLYFFVYGLYNKKLSVLFLAGIIFCISIYFSLTFLPMILFFLLFGGIYAIQNHLHLRRIFFFIMAFCLGIFVLPMILFFAFDFNSIEMAQQIMKYHFDDQKARQYGVWVFYNVYDFFLFFGIPLTVLFFTWVSTTTKKFFETKLKYLKNVDVVFLSFILFFLAIDLEGAVRGETARIWMPYMPLLLIPLANYITNRVAFSKWQFIGLLLLQATQVVVFQSVLATLY